MLPTGGVSIHAGGVLILAGAVSLLHGACSYLQGGVDTLEGEVQEEWDGRVPGTQQAGGVVSEHKLPRGTTAALITTIFFPYQVSMIIITIMNINIVITVFMLYIYVYIEYFSP